MGDVVPELRRVLVAVTACVLACVGALAPTAVGPEPEPAAAADVPPAATAAGALDRPNILLITSDDQRADDMEWMPYTNRLIAGQGIDVTGFISPHPLCCPARAELLTGEYAQNNGVRHNAGPYGGWTAFVENGNVRQQLGRWLHRAGYQTGFVGKMLNGYGPDSTPLPGFDHWNPTIDGTYSYYGTTFFADGNPVSYPDDYVADVVSGYTRAYVKDFAAQEQPWFLWVSHVGPHKRARPRVGSGPPIPAERHAALFPDAFPPSLTAPSFSEEDVSDKPPAVSSQDPVSVEGMTTLFRARIRSLQAIDEANRAVIRQLRRSGELDNTVVVYTSDNGLLLGEHRISGKNYPYEEALRVPFLIRGPGLPAGTTVPDRMTMVDVASTILARAGALDSVRTSGHTDGIDMMPVLRGEASGPSTHLIQAGTNLPEALDSYGWGWRGVSTARWTFAHWYDGSEELYDRWTDPWELENLAGAPGYQSVLQELRQRLDQLSTCAGADACNHDFGAEPRP